VTEILARGFSKSGSERSNRGRRMEEWSCWTRLEDPRILRCRVVKSENK
jgi:hypothetical protein